MAFYPRMLKLEVWTFVGIIVFSLTTGCPLCRVNSSPVSKTFRRSITLFFHGVVPYFLVFWPVICPNSVTNLGMRGYNTLLNSRSGEVVPIRTQGMRGASLCETDMVVRFTNFVLHFGKNKHTIILRLGPVDVN